MPRLLSTRFLSRFSSERDCPSRSRGLGTAPEMDNSPLLFEKWTFSRSGGRPRPVQGRTPAIGAASIGDRCRRAGDQGQKIPHKDAGHAPISTKASHRVVAYFRLPGPNHNAVAPPAALQRMMNGAALTLQLFGTPPTPRPLCRARRENWSGSFAGVTAAYVDGRFVDRLVRIFRSDPVQSNPNSSGASGVAAEGKYARP